MSSFTRANKGDRVRFKDASGKTLDGLVLGLRGTDSLVGVQSTEKPQLWGELRTDFGKVRTHKVTGRPLMGWIPNNSIWVVPFTSITETYIPTVESESNVA